MSSLYFSPSLSSSKNCSRKAGTNVECEILLNSSQSYEDECKTTYEYEKVNPTLSRKGKSLWSRLQSARRRPFHVMMILLGCLILLHVVCKYFKIVKRYHQNSFYVHYRKKYDRCKFVPKGRGPQPVLLMSLGRSGSSITWKTISSLAVGAESTSTSANEVTGGNKESSKEYFDDIQDHIGKHWIWLKLCNIQRYHMEKRRKNNEKGYDANNIVGFQWKPYIATFDHHYAIEGLEEIASMDNVKVILLTRNALDRYMSNIRHKGFQHSDEVPAHCSVDDVECIKRHKEHSQGLTLQCDEEFLSRLRHNLYLDEVVADRLSTLGVKHLHVAYEHLYHSTDESDIAEGWLRINRFLGIGEQNNLTIGEVKEHFEYASTSPPNHREIIANYDQVEKFLKNSDLGYLLH